MITNKKDSLAYSMGKQIRSKLISKQILRISKIYFQQPHSLFSLTLYYSFDFAID
jgi:hypothetical protein